MADNDYATPLAPPKPRKPSSCNFGWCFLSAAGDLYPETHSCDGRAECLEKLLHSDIPRDVCRDGCVIKVKLVDNS